MPQGINTSCALTRKRQKKKNSITNRQRLPSYKDRRCEKSLIVGDRIHFIWFYHHVNSSFRKRTFYTTEHSAGKTAFRRIPAWHWLPHWRSTDTKDRLWHTNGPVHITSWTHGIQNSIEAILSCHPALSKEWLRWAGWQLRANYDVCAQTLKENCTPKS